MLKLISLIRYAVPVESSLHSFDKVASRVPHLVDFDAAEVRDA